MLFRFHICSLIVTACIAAAITPGNIRAEEAAQESPDEAKIRKLIFTLQNVGAKDVLVPLLEFMEAGKLSVAQMDDLLWSVSAALEDSELEIVFARVLAAKPESVAFQARLLQALVSAQRDRGAKPAGDSARIKTLIDNKDEAVRAEALRLAGGWGVEDLRKALTTTAESSVVSKMLLSAAFDGLASLGGPASIDVFEKLCSGDRALSTRYSAVAALTMLDVNAAAAAAIDVLAQEPNGNGPAEVFAAFVKRDGGQEVLATALKGKTIPVDVAKIGLRYLQALGGEETALLKALRPLAALTADVSELAPEEQKKIVAEIMAEVPTKGDPARGEQIFRKIELNCLSCHGIGGAGGQVGPDLAGIGAGAQLDYLVEAVLLPSKVVKEGFEGALVATNKGEFFTGIIKNKTEEEITIRDAVHGEMTFAVADLKRHKQLPVSLMPNGLTATLTRGETLDLLRFLSELGRDPYSVTAAPIVRRWRVLNPLSDDVAALDLKSLVAQGDKLSWLPAYSTVAGVLPAADLVRAKTKPVAVARFEFEMTTPGKMKLKLNSPKGLTLCVNDAPIGDLTLDVPRGVQTVTVRVDLEQRGAEPLKIELEELPDSPGRFQVIGGR